MPRATVQEDVVRHELKSCPGGYIELKQLPYFDMIRRRDNATRMSMDAASTSKGKQDDRKLYIETFSEWATRFDFENCIVDHNLEDAHGRKLDFSNPLSLKVLDPRVGTEIENLIADLNQFEDDDEALEDFTDAPKPSSVDS